MVDHNSTPGENASGTRPDEPKPPQMILEEHVRKPEDKQDFSIMTQQEAQQLHDFMDLPIRTPEDIYRAIGLTPYATDRAVRYHFDPRTQRFSGQKFDNPLRAEENGNAARRYFST